MYLFLLALLSVFSAPLIAAEPSTADFTDLSMVMKQAVLSDPKIRMSKYEISIADEQDAQALGQLLPQVRAGAQYTWNDRTLDGQPSDSYNGEKYTLTANQVLFSYDRFNGKKRTSSLLDKNILDFEDTLDNVLLSAAEKYLLVLGAKDNLTLVQAEKENIQGQLSQYHKLYEKGLIRITDLLDAQMRADLIAADEIEATNSVEIAIEEIVKLTGKRYRNFAPFKAHPVFPSIEGDSDFWLQRAIQSSPILLSQNKAIEAAKYKIEQARGAHFPTVDLQLSHLKTDLGYDNAEAPRSNTNVAALVLNVPLYSGGGDQARLREARDQYELETARSDEMVRSISQGVRESYLNASAAMRRIDASKKALESTEKSYKAMQESFKYGTVSLMVVLDAMEDEFTARRNYLKAQYAYLLSWLRLHYFAGDLGEEQLIAINELLDTVR